MDSDKRPRIVTKIHIFLFFICLSYLDYFFNTIFALLTTTREKQQATSSRLIDPLSIAQRLSSRQYLVCNRIILKISLRK